MSVYVTRSRNGVLGSEPSPISDVAFVNQRFNGGNLRGARFEHCTFANISFLNAELRDCHFHNCVFDSCYFRGTKLIECHFPASRFINCEFPHPTLFACGFQQTRFHRSVPRFSVIEPSLPGEPNLCRQLCENLAAEASRFGNAPPPRLYRLRAIHEHQAELRNGYRWADDYSKDHYPELERVAAFVRLCGSRLNGWLWGHGEYLSRLVLNVLILGVLIGPILLYLAREHLHAYGSVSLGDCIALSIASVVNTPASSGVSATGIGLAIVLCLTALGLVFLGLFVTYLFRAVTRR